jgi:PhnB protein
MAGLDPASTSSSALNKKDVDARHKAGHDEIGKISTPPVGLHPSRSSLDCASPIHPRRRAMNIRNSKTIDETKIRNLIDDRANALRNKDARGVISHLAEDFVQFSLAPPLIATDANVKGFEAWFATWQGQLGCELRDLTIAVGDGIAFSHSLNRMTGTKTDGQKVDLWFRQTLCFRTINGTWAIVHEHESVPFYMDGSFRAAIDLKP